MFKRIRYNSPVVLTFVFTSFAALILNWITGGMANRLFFSVYSMGAYFEPLMAVRLFGYVLGHASLEHYISNMTIILLVGPMLEEKYGSKKLLSLILVTAAVTGLIQMLLFQGAILGASGIAFAMILLSSFTVSVKDEIPLTFILVAVIFIGQQIYEGIAVSDNISNMAHIVGGLVGGVIGYLLNRKPTSRTSGYGIKY